MNELLYSPKIKPEHLARKAIVYLRQSSDRQVRQNLESQRLQYELAERIHSLGWQEIEVINSDLGCSAAVGAATREGFERVLSAVPEDSRQLLFLACAWNVTDAELIALGLEVPPRAIEPPSTPTVPVTLANGREVQRLGFLPTRNTHLVLHHLPDPELDHLWQQVEPSVSGWSSVWRQVVWACPYSCLWEWPGRA